MSKCPNDNVFYRNLHWHYPKITHGNGIYLYDEEGNRYIDSASGAAVCNVGHGRKEIGEAIAAQAAKIEFAHGSRWANEPSTILAAKLAKITPKSLNKIYFTSIGSESIETAIKLSRSYFLERDGKSQKYKIISRQPSYHGATIGTMTVSGNFRFRHNYVPYFGNFGKHIPAPYCYRCPYGLMRESCGLRCAKALEYAILQEGAENVAAFICEPVIGSSIPGFSPPKGYYQIIRDICNKHDILMICDEVMTGFGRTGKAFGISHFDVEPDMMCFGKAMGAGYVPLGGVAIRDNIYAIIDAGSGKFNHGHTYGHHVLSCAAGSVIMDIYEKENLFENAKQMGDYLADKLLSMVDYPIVGEIRNVGLLMGIEFVTDKSKKQPFDPKLGVAELITVVGLKNGIVLYPGGGSVNGKYGDHVLICPPLIINKEQCDDFINRLDKTIKIACEQLNN